MDYFFNKVNKLKSYFSTKAESEQETEAPDSSSNPSTSGRFGGRQQIQVQRQPVIQSAGYSGSGGVQGLDWYKAGLKTDTDGDFADEFLLEPSNRRNHSLDKPLKVQQRNVKVAALKDADLYVDQGQVLILQDEKTSNRRCCRIP